MRKTNISITLLDGTTLGGLVAGYLSWTTWHSVGWAILHFIFNWFYVLYWLINYGN